MTLSKLKIAQDVGIPVSISNLSTQMLLASVVISDAYFGMGYVCEITGGREGKHKPGSLHFTGQALDYRIRNIAPAKRPELVRRVEEALGKDYDVVLHSTHLHVEYQPNS